MAVRNVAMRRAFAVAFQTRCYSAPSARAIPAAKQKYVPTTGTYPKGFLAGTSHAGVKASNTTHDDLTMVISETPCAAAGVFTKNIFKAAPVQVSRQILRARTDKLLRGVVVNSGCANAVTGKLGLEHAQTMARETDKCFGAVGNLPQTLVMSTGVIGQRLPIDKITAAIPKAHQALGATHDHWLKAAAAICTTDTFPKLLSRTFTLPSHPETEYRIAGMTKGAGMIHPNMATLLDAKIDAQSAKIILQTATNRSFNCISIDGDTSTNDSVALFANGAATPEGTIPMEVPVKYVQEAGKAPGAPEGFSPDTAAFTDVLQAFLADLAKLVVRDGEGATKFVTVRVRSETSLFVAKRVATSIARSALVKTALYGKDANWGRILCAIGYTPGIMDTRELPIKPLMGSARPVVPERTSVSFLPADGSAELKLLVRGEPEAVDEARARQILEMEDLEVLVRLEDGPVRRQHEDGRSKGKDREQRKVYEAVVWTCDLSHEYVTINGDYRT
ncbi:glutamate N-acetyltransferase [Teratosphaeriaceae sp. CCFEE 6253]|nr:glutamate N-acetyltransferase [Teratosphaeriaceae sp. CCFEE 6253]KAK3111250.1 glutamate N-acetyltransferase [Teratosphaeriaceae sp. CCFEE 6253]